MALQTVLLGVTGGIAAYKAAELARLLVRNGSAVQAVMTPAALHFITPLTFQTITGRPALVDSFDPAPAEKVRHIELAGQAAVLVVAPATANTLAKMARGIADNLLTTLYLAVTCPVVLVPSMNERMFAHQAVQENLGLLRSHGCHVMDPAAGELACGVIGKGRMPEPPDIVNFIRAALTGKDFAGVSALVTAGPTREPLDPVRFLSNPSSGLMGYSLARALSERGAAVTLVSGPTNLACPAGVALVPVTTTAEMRLAVLRHYPACGLVIKAAAPLDFRPARAAAQKVKKEGAPLTLELAPTPDILQELGRQKENRVLVGFAAETEHIEEHARRKLREKNLDLIVVNDLTKAGAGFASPTNQVRIIDAGGGVEELPLMEKEALAHRILDRAAALLHRSKAKGL